MNTLPSSSPYIHSSLLHLLEKIESIVSQVTSFGSTSIDSLPRPSSRIESSIPTSSPSKGINYAENRKEGKIRQQEQQERCDPVEAQLLSERRYYYVLPVLFLEYLALSIPRSLLPSLLNHAFGSYTYHVLGIVETVKGILAFVSCPLFGRLSDMIGRRFGLLFTVVGTVLPIFVLWSTESMYSYVVAQGLSGLFASTFTITFAYIADLVGKERRSAAYGLALATFGLSYCLGPIFGGILVNFGSVSLTFGVSLLCAGAALLYIIFILPESRPLSSPRLLMHKDSRKRKQTFKREILNESNEVEANTSNVESEFGPTSSTSHFTSLSDVTENLHAINNINDISPFSFRNSISIVEDLLPNQWSPFSVLEIFSGDPFLYRVGQIVFLYYIGVWAIVSTLMVHVQRQFHADEFTIGEVLSVFGISTMLSEGVLVRLVVPYFGEINAIRIGLAAFFLQCINIAIASSVPDIFFSLIFSFFANLVYPSISSLVSRSVPPSRQGEAIGAMNGLRALTEGFGPLLFGTLMYTMQDTNFPGAPYLLASVFAAAAWYLTYQLPSVDSYDIYLFQQEIEMERLEGGEEAVGLLASKKSKKKNRSVLGQSDDFEGESSGSDSDSENDHEENNALTSHRRKGPERSSKDFKGSSQNWGEGEEDSLQPRTTHSISV